MMPCPITKSQFSNNVLVSGKGKPLTEHQETHFVERHDLLTIGSSLVIDPLHIPYTSKGQNDTAASHP